MPSATVYDMDGQVVREENLDMYVFGAAINTAVLHQVVTAQLVNRRQGTASTKTRAYVSGGNSKPYRQKGTGRARQGSTRAPQFRGGGTVFGPKPHAYERAIPRKVKRIAIRSALSDKAANNRIILMDSLTLEEPRTRDMENLLQRLPLDGRHVLLLLPERNENVILATRNIRRVKLANVASTNVVELLKYDHVLMPIASAQRLVEMFGRDADDAIQMRRHPRVVTRLRARDARGESKIHGPAGAAATTATAPTAPTGTTATTGTTGTTGSTRPPRSRAAKQPEQGGEE